MEQRKVLLLSRNPLIINAFEFLKKHFVNIATSTKKAMDLISKEKFDLVVVFDDVEGENLPTRAVEKIKNEHGMLPVIFIALTAKSLERAKCCGADRAYLLQQAMSIEKDIVCELCSEYEKLSLGARAVDSEQETKALGN